MSVVSAIWEVEVGEVWGQPKQHSQDAISKQTRMAGGGCRRGSEVECLPSTWEVVNSESSEQTKWSKAKLYASISFNFAT